ncbi:MAG: serine/threonine-protein kinase, partial [Vicinamibacterales bacterium]|nr:serine/threonine-protein kinase [Vicinamibacterales bacterium]
LEGETLAARLLREGEVEVTEAVRILRPVLGALRHAHRKGISHRDLKPGNLFLLEDGRVKVLDFGIAKFISAQAAPEAETAAGTLLGTWRYMSPEQLRGGTVLPAWDLWALSVVAYEMLTGAHPFAAATVDDCHQAVLAGRFT